MIYWLVPLLVTLCSILECPQHRIQRQAITRCWNNSKVVRDTYTLLRLQLQTNRNDDYDLSNGPLWRVWPVHDDARNPYEFDDLFGPRLGHKPMTHCQLWLLLTSLRTWEPKTAPAAACVPDHMDFSLSAEFVWIHSLSLNTCFTSLQNGLVSIQIFLVCKGV